MAPITLAAPTSGVVTLTSECAKGLAPPNQYPRAVWDQLVALGRLKYAGQGLYQLADR